MPREGAIIFRDLTGKLTMLRVTCVKCGREGRYNLAYLIGDRGPDAKVTDWLAEITADCPKKIKQSFSDQCGARCPDLATVL